jgi:hypothetical protein
LTECTGYDYDLEKVSAKSNVHDSDFIHLMIFEGPSMR